MERGDSLCRREMRGTRITLPQLHSIPLSTLIRWQFEQPALSWSRAHPRILPEMGTLGFYFRYDPEQKYVLDVGNLKRVVPTMFWKRLTVAGVETLRPHIESKLPHPSRFWAMNTGEHQNSEAPH